MIQQTARAGLSLDVLIVAGSVALVENWARLLIAALIIGGAVFDLVVHGHISDTLQVLVFISFGYYFGRGEANLERARRVVGLRKRSKDGA